MHDGGSTAQRGAVLVTGASSGIGRATAEHLAHGGFRVFAGVAEPGHAAAVADLAQLGVTPVVLDVTDAVGVAGAAREVTAALGGRPLAGLVNNAGIGVAWPVEHVPAEELHRQFDVNVFGPVRVTQAFLPLLRASAGRIVTVGSIGGRITMPFGGPLCGSKAAVRSLTDAMRLELRPWGIRVVLVEPSRIHTAAVDALEAAVEPTVERLGPAGRAHYERAYRAMTSAAVRRERAGSPPAVVAATVYRALTAPRPRSRYLVGADAGRLAVLARLPARAVDPLLLRALGMPTRAGRAGRATSGGAQNA